MALERLKSVIALVADSTIVELNYSEGDTHISLVRRAVGEPAGTSQPDVATPGAATPDATAPDTATPAGTAGSTHRNGATATASAPRAASPAPAPAKAASATPAAPPAVAPAAGGDTVVLAPMASLFHRSPSPQAKPFVEVGDTCQPGDKLCILEAMKVFTVLDAECAGTIAEFYVNDGDEVDIDQPILRISRG